MDPYLMIAWGLFLIPTLTMIILGLVYLSNNKIMPYHQRALPVSWDELSGPFQVLLNTLVRAIGTYSLVSGLALLFIIIYFFKHPPTWALWAVPLLTLLYVGLTILIAKNLGDKTPGGPNIFPLVLLMLCTLLGIAFSLTAIYF